MFLKAIYCLGAILSFACGLVGLALPIVPQVPFFVLAAVLFCKVSPKFERWFYGTRVGALIEQLRKEKDFSKKKQILKEKLSKLLSKWKNKKDEFFRIA